jgi:Spy/CpxP family protein refolding chaperone
MAWERTMKRTMGGLIVLAAMTALSAPDLAAQRGPRAQQGFGNRGGRAGVEMIMRMRAELELTEGQIQELDAIRQEVVQRRSAHQAEMAELRSRLQAGEIEREAVRDAMEGRAEAMQEAADRERERIEAILNETQRETLEEMAPRTGALARRGRAGPRADGFGMRGGGPRGARMFRPGMRGSRGGFSPGPRQGFAPGFGPRAPGMRGFFR